MRVLITGFEPFEKRAFNTSWEAVRNLPSELEGNIEIKRLCVPTVFSKSIEVVTKKIEELNPDVVILVGEAGHRKKITVERIGINIDDARISDNAGVQPIDREIEPNSENAYFTTLPIKAIVANLNRKGFTSAISNSAGTFVCNHLFYGTLHYIKQNRLRISAGFVHLPFIQEEHNIGVMPFSKQELTEALIEIIKQSARNKINQ